MSELLLLAYNITQQASFLYFVGIGKNIWLRLGEKRKESDGEKVVPNSGTN